MRRMLAQQEDVFYYVTLMNESYAQPSLPAGAEEGILRGMHRVRGVKNAKVRLLGAGTILQAALAAAELLEKDWSIAADVFSVTSFTELRREAMAKTRAKRLKAPSALGEGHSWIESRLPPTGAPVVAASDYVSAVPDLIRPWIEDLYIALGTDGFGRSDTRASLRRFFEVDRHSIAVAALSALGDARLPKALERYGIDPRSAAPWTR
jgi:pyruvate dehydrogenase E1 component